MFDKFMQGLIAVVGVVAFGYLLHLGWNLVR